MRCEGADNVRYYINNESYYLLFVQQGELVKPLREGKNINDLININLDHYYKNKNKEKSLFSIPRNNYCFVLNFF